MKSKDSIYLSVKSALLISLIILSSYIYIPMPSVSVLSLQTVVINLVSLILTPLQSFITVALWLIMGAVGLPVFSGGAGLGKLFGITGGFYWGFLIAVPLMSLFKGKKAEIKRYFLVCAFIGVTVEHICAVFVMCLHNGFNVFAAFQSVSLPFILGDIIKCFISSFIAVKINSIKAINQDRHR